MKHRWMATEAQRAQRKGQDDCGKEMDGEGESGAEAPHSRRCARIHARWVCPSLHCYFNSHGRKYDMGLKSRFVSHIQKGHFFADLL